MMISLRYFNLTFLWLVSFHLPSRCRFLCFILEPDIHSCHLNTVCQVDSFSVFSKLIRPKSAFYLISVRQFERLRPTSFRSHVTMGTFVFLTVPTSKPVMDFHHRVVVHAEHTIKRSLTFKVGDLFHISQHYWHSG